MQKVIDYKINKRAFLIINMLFGIVLTVAGCSSKVKSFSFSKPSGFYKNDFLLKINSPGGDIYYTLDGSTPDKTKNKYVGPITISNPEKYINALNTNTSGGFFYHDGSNNQLASHYRTTFEEVDTATVIRAIYYDDNDRPSELINGFYKIGSINTEPSFTISLSLDSSALFDNESGIYVLGKAFEEYKKNNDNWANEPWRWWNGNFRNKGRESEREAVISVFNQNGETIFDSNCGIRIKGNVSRGFAQKSMNIYLRKEYQDILFQFPNGYEARKMSIDSGASDLTRLQDKLVSFFSEDLNICVMHYYPCDLYINGEYWGGYNLTEKYDDRYIEHYYKVDKDNVILIKNGEVEEGLETDLSIYKDAIKYLEETDMTSLSNYEKACSLFDMSSLIDYFAVQTYINNSAGDWPASNIAAWRSRSTDTSYSRYKDGKWRWMLFDLNGGILLDNYYVGIDTINYFLVNSKLFSSLWKQELFKVQFLSRLESLSDVFDTESVNNYINVYIERYYQSLKKSYDRFYDDDNSSLIKDKANDINLFFSNRVDVISELLSKYRN